MGIVRLRIFDDHFVAVKTVKFFGVLNEEAVAQYCFRGIIVLLVIESVHASEVRDVTFCGNAGASEKDDVVALFDPFF